MIPVQTAYATVEGNLDGAKFAMKFDSDPKSVALMMELLSTKLYSDPVAACIREYSTNAWDAHVEAGTTRPIEVTTPTTMYPFLRIKDYGTGMNAETIEKVYSLYGASTKRETDLANGTMGIGGKSALAYSEQFTVIGIQDSIKTQVSVSRDSVGAGVMEIVDESLTDEPNGVEVVIPARRNGAFEMESTAKKFFRFWKPGTVLLNGKEPVQSLTKVTDRIYIMDTEGRYGANDQIVMGNVAYPVPDGLVPDDTFGYYSKPKIAVFVEMGGDDAVEFTPAREALNYTAKTKAVVAGIKKEYREHVVKLINESMLKVTSFGEAYEKYVELNKTYDNSLLEDLTYKGHKMPSGYIMEKVSKTKAAYTADDYIYAIKWDTNASRYSVESNSRLTYDTLMQAMVVINYTPDSGVAGSYKAKTREYQSQNSLSHRHVIFLHGSKVPGSPWTDTIPTVEWEDVRTVVMPKKARTGNGGSTKSYGGGFDVYIPANPSWNMYETQALNPGDKVIYYSKSQLGGYRPDELDVNTLNLFTKYLPSYKVIKAGKNRQDKLLRDHPGSLTVGAAKEEALKIVSDAVTDDDKAYLRDGEVTCIDYLAGVNYNDIDDPFVSRVLKLQDAGEPEALKALHRLSATEYNKLVKEAGSAEMEDISERYPLLERRYGSMSGRMIPDTVLYLNAKYATITKETK